jgi:hypothetical protein
MGMLEGLPACQSLKVRNELVQTGLVGMELKLEALMRWARLREQAIHGDMPEAVASERHVLLLTAKLKLAFSAQ